MSLHNKNHSEVFNLPHTVTIKCPNPQNVSIYLSCNDDTYTPFGETNNDLEEVF